MKNFSREQLEMARMADLCDYLLAYHDDEFIEENSCIRLRDNQSLAIKRGYSGYIDFATGEHGNSVDFLTKYMGYTIVEAVLALCGDDDYVSTEDYTVREEEPPELEDVPVEFPEQLLGSYKQLFAYLMSRDIPQNVIQMLIDKELMYQEAEHNNIVFINKARDFAEIRGTYTYGKPFHGCRKKKPDRFWWFCSHEKAEIAYICEAAIDAISLYVLHQRDGRTEPAYYISIAGVANQQTIDRIKSHIRTVLAVDNDDAGSTCRKRNPELESIIPTYKDWNEDLKNYSEIKKTKEEKEKRVSVLMKIQPFNCDGPIGGAGRMYFGYKRYFVTLKDESELEILKDAGYKIDLLDEGVLVNYKEKSVCVYFFEVEEDLFT